MSAAESHVFRLLLHPSSVKVLLTEASEPPEAEPPEAEPAEAEPAEAETIPVMVTAPMAPARPESAAAKPVVIPSAADSAALVKNLPEPPAGPST